jgi:hypothetical protein
MRLPTRFVLAGSLALATVAGCGGDTPTGSPGPTPGPLTLTLATPNGDDGALMFTVRGAVVQGFTPAAGLTAYTTPVGQTFIKIVLVGPLPSGPVGRLQVPDTRNAASYTVAVLQAASATSYAPRSPSGYSIGVSR